MKRLEKGIKETEKNEKKNKGKTNLETEKQPKQKLRNLLKKGRKRKIPILYKPKESDSSDSDSSGSLCLDSDEGGSSPMPSSSDESLPDEIEPTTIDPRLEMYYAVYYDLDWYVGRVIDFPDEGLCKVKFLKKVLNNFKWPVHDDIQTVANKFVFYGPGQSMMTFKLWQTSLCSMDQLN
ncbi:unnamed protein product [Euphydryas editha]|uniref:Uncharacterized protein n=1 Tax=Euphydryas editha TaxID=104508 RepID=A0AAU9UM80_EUPED|nr:unnamed protein product [Euphydryas editha]